MTRFVLAFCLVRSQWSGKVYLGVHYADVRAPECTGQASGSQVGEGVGGLQEGGVRARADSRPSDSVAVWLPPWLVGWQRSKVWPLEMLPGQETRTCQALTWSCQTVFFEHVHCWFCSKHCLILLIIFFKSENGDVSPILYPFSISIFYLRLQWKSFTLFII